MNLYIHLTIRPTKLPANGDLGVGGDRPRRQRACEREREREKGLIQPLSYRHGGVSLDALVVKKAVFVGGGLAYNNIYASPPKSHT